MKKSQLLNMNTEADHILTLLQFIRLQIYKKKIKKNSFYATVRPCAHIFIYCHYQ
jgi:hypothetical protein